MFSPCVTTLQQAITNVNLLSWPVKNLNFHKLLKTTLATEKGYLDQERKYLNPTTKPHMNKNEDTMPEKITSRTNSLFLQVCQPLTLSSLCVVTNAVLAFVTKVGRKKCQNSICYDFTSKITSKSKMKKYPFCLAKTYKLLK